ncbi:MAG: hypothetical protein KDH84_14105, partial [Calditrichaeota bacterium]|nr:hypothetical protein [Calditrichota bacterium]
MRNLFSKQLYSQSSFPLTHSPINPLTEFYTTHIFSTGGIMFGDELLKANKALVNGDYQKALKHYFKA